MATTTRMTVEQMETMPDGGRGYELVSGELVEVPPPAFEHSDIGATLTGELYAHVKPLGLGTVLVESHVVLDRARELVRVPDVAFVRAERVPRGESRQRYFDGAPDLAVEIVFPSDSFTAVQNKAMEYLSAGTGLVWIVEPIGRTVTVYEPGGRSRVLTEDDNLDGGNVIPGFSLPVLAIFA